jgi:recombinational DNA repair protein RecR
MPEENKKIYVIFWEDTLINKWISNVLRLKIKQEYFLEIRNSDDYIIVDLHKNIDSEQIKEYIKAINTLFNNVTFISLYIDWNLAQSELLIKKIKRELNITNLDYIKDILWSFQNVPQN